MTKEARITSISMNNFYESSDASMQVCINSPNTGSVYFNLKGPQLQSILSLVWEMVEINKKEMARKVLELKTPVALQAPNAKLIEGE